MKYIRIKELSDRLGVTKQRTHQLIKTYGVEVVKVHPRMFIVSLSEARKIPDTRLSGVNLKCLKKRGV